MPTRFNPPPNWPAPPAGWTPPPGWQPDPAWPPPPPGWRLWVEDAPARGPAEWGPGQRPMEQGPMGQAPMMQNPPMQGPVAQGSRARVPVISADSRWTLGGGAAIFIGSLLPWVSATVTESNLGLGVSGLSYSITGGAIAVSAVFGLILIGLAFAMQSKAARGTLVKPKAYSYGVPFIVLSALGLLGYALFTVAGIVGFTENDEFGATAKITFTPSVGLILLLLGCIAALIGGIKVMRHATPRTR